MYRFLNPPEIRHDQRLIWAATRSVLENGYFSRNRRGKKSRSRWELFIRLLKIFAWFLKITGYYRKGYGNAKTITVSEITLHFGSLPEAFEDIRILHLSDLHIDSIPGLASILIERIRGIHFDLCLLTGDYRRDKRGSFRHILKPLRILAKHIKAPYGTFAVLGNHDTWLMSNYEKETGIELLINESVEIEKEGQKILITGTDDPFDFFTEPAILCLETAGYPFKIAMVHTPELAKTASDNGYALYLCGHTHGGQICLRPNQPLISHQFEGKQYNNGLWKLGNLTGYTSRGVGVSGIPIRFNCPAEVTLFTLQRKTH